MPQGYIRYPHIHHDHIVFVSEDDLWLVASTGGRAERLTAGVDTVSYPRFSPDGQYLAFVGREEGPSEIYVMPALGGPAQRLTFQAGSCRVLGWSPSGDEILYASNAGQYISKFWVIYAIRPDGSQPRQLPVGMANAISYGPDGGVVLGRNVREAAHWKRYRGGTVGHLWCDTNGSGNFQRLLNLEGNIAAPNWVGQRIYFLSDHEGIGNIYSCTPQGTDVRRHTSHQDFYARHLSDDGQRMVYHAGADLYLFDPQTDETQKLDVDLPSLRTQRNRKFVSASRFLDSYALHPQGYAVALTTRGKAFSMGNWEGPVLQHGEPDGSWLAYSFANTSQTTVIKLCNMETGETHFATEPVLYDECPSFDPEGKYLYFLGYRTLNPVRDNFQFEFSFPKGVKPYAIMLRSDERSPFTPEPRVPQSKDKDKGAKNPPNGAEKETTEEQGEQEETSKKSSLIIDLEGITSRVVPFPVKEARFRAVRGIKGKALFLTFPVEGQLHDAENHDHEPKGSIFSYDFETLKQEWLLDGVSGFDLSRDYKTLIYRSNYRLPVLKAGDKAPKSDSSEPSPESGWLNLQRVKVSVQPAAEWKQMFTEAWRLQREHFWAEDMAGIDWQAIYDQYV